MRPLRLFLASFVLLATASAGHAAPLRTLHVATTGNDGADGSAATPWRTMQRAANAARAGDLIVVRPGRYAGFNLTTSGTATNPIVFSAEPGVIVDTPNTVRPQEGINLEGASFIVIEGFTVVGMPRTGIRSVLNHHVTIRRNVGDANGRWGILTGFSDDLLIEDNEMSRSVAEHGIYVSNSGDRPVIRRNHVWGNSGNGIHMNGDLSQGGDGIISGAVVEANVIHGNGRTGGSGINGDGVQSSRIVNNILYDNHASGISLYRIDGAQGARNNLVAHNTIVQAADGRWAINIQNASTGNRVVNNILLSLHTFRGAIAISPDSLPGFVSDANALTGRFTLDGGNSVLALAAWRQATGQDLHSFVQHAGGTVRRRRRWRLPPARRRPRPRHCAGADRRHHRLRRQAAPGRARGRHRRRRVGRRRRPAASAAAGPGRSRRERRVESTGQRATRRPLHRHRHREERRGHRGHAERDPLLPVGRPGEERH